MMKKWGQIGITMYKKTGVMTMITGGFEVSINMATQIFQALKSIIVQPDINKLGGPVAIFQQSAQVANEGLITIIAYMAFSRALRILGFLIYSQFQP